jgi:hypothetical protein
MGVIGTNPAIVLFGWFGDNQPDRITELQAGRGT